MLSQAADAEQRRSRLRAGRAEEAIPFITLPQSLLLQRSDGEQGQNTDQENVLSNAQAASEIEAANRRSGYGNELWNSVQESASDVVEDAREAFFADSMKAAKAIATTVTTTSYVVTTLDPAVLAKQLNITTDAARARNLLVGMIERAQLGLLNRLTDISMDLEATEARAKSDLKAVNHSFIIAKNMPIMANNAEVDVSKIETNADKLKVSIPAIERRATSHVAEIAELYKKKEQLDKDIGASKKLPGAKKRVENNAQTLNAILPRLEQLQRRVTKLESRLYDGDIDKVVDDTTGKEVMNVMEDVSRGFGRFIANPK